MSIVPENIDIKRPIINRTLRMKSFQNAVTLKEFTHLSKNIFIVSAKNKNNVNPITMNIPFILFIQYPPTNLCS